MFLNESLAKKDGDIIFDYVMVEDIDGNKQPSWNFVAKIATAENRSDDYIIEKAIDFGYKLFRVEASSFCKLIVAPKAIHEEDIYEEYAKYLEGMNAVVTQIKL